MAALTMEEVLEHARALPPDQRRRLQRALDAIAQDESSENAEETLVERLLADGVITRRPNRPAASPPWEPLAISGEPLSQTIIKDRR